MKTRMTYWSRKAGRIIAEGRRKNKTIFLFVLPDVEKIAQSSLFTQEKKDKILTKIQSLDYREKQNKKTSPKVRTTNIIRTIDKDEERECQEESIEEMRKLVEMGDLI